MFFGWTFAASALAPRSIVNQLSTLYESKHNRFLHANFSAVFQRYLDRQAVCDFYTWNVLVYDSSDSQSLGAANSITSSWTNSCTPNDSLPKTLKFSNTRWQTVTILKIKIFQNLQKRLADFLLQNFVDWHILCLQTTQIVEILKFSQIQYGGWPSFWQLLNAISLQSFDQFWLNLIWWWITILPVKQSTKNWQIWQCKLVDDYHLDRKLCYGWGTARHACQYRN